MATGLKFWRLVNGYVRVRVKVESQCNEACLKANRMLGLIKRTFVVKTPEVMLNLYKTLVRPHLE